MNDHDLFFQHCFQGKVYLRDKGPKCRPVWCRYWWLRQLSLYLAHDLIRYSVLKVCIDASCGDVWADLSPEGVEEY